MKTLIVEDDSGSRLVLEGMLRERGHEVCSCADAETAWDAYQHEVHSLVLLDWRLPSMDGLQICRQMRALPPGNRSVVLVITGRGRLEDLRAVLAAGADDYLATPGSTSLAPIRSTPTCVTTLWTTLPHTNETAFPHGTGCILLDDDEEVFAQRAVQALHARAETCPDNPT